MQKLAQLQDQEIDNFQSPLRTRYVQDQVGNTDRPYLSEQSSPRDFGTPVTEFASATFGFQDCDQKTINIQIESPERSSSLVLIEATAEKPLADTLVPQSGFKVIEDFDENEADSCAHALEQRQSIECGRCSLRFSDPAKLFAHLKSHEASFGNEITNQL